MGLRKMLRLGITPGFEHTIAGDGVKPLCPREHDLDSLARLIRKNKSWRLAKKTASMASTIIGQPAPEGLDDVLLVEALKQHDNECVNGPESKWCHCDWCNKRRESLKNADD